MLLFLHVVLSKRNCALWMDQGETASVEPPFAAGHLWDTVGPDNERQGEQKMVHPIHFV